MSGFCQAIAKGRGSLEVEGPRPVVCGCFWIELYIYI